MSSAVIAPIDYLTMSWCCADAIELCYNESVLCCSSNMITFYCSPHYWVRKANLGNLVKKSWSSCSESIICKRCLGISNLLSVDRMTAEDEEAD
jgi:hypothetical protein